MNIRMKNLLFSNKPSITPSSCWLIIFTLALTFRVAGVTLTFAPVADSEIRQFTADGNFGTDSSVVSGKLGSSSLGEIRRALFRFDLSSIPLQSQIISATLKLQVTKVPSLGDAPGSTFDLRRVLKTWSEVGVTWNNRLSPGTPWETAGASGPTDVSGIASSSVAVGPIGPYIFSSTTNLVADVKLWVTNSSNNFGWLLISQDEATGKTARHFGAKEDPANAPVLTVDFITAPPATNNIVLTNLILSGNQFSFSFQAETNKTYTAESVTSISATNWTAVTNFPSSGAPLTRVVTTSLTSSNRFFRVKSP